MISILIFAQIVRVNLFPGRKDLPGKADRNGAVGRDGGLGRPGWDGGSLGRDPGTSGCPHQSVADSLFGEGRKRFWMMVYQARVLSQKAMHGIGVPLLMNF